MPSIPYAEKHLEIYFILKDKLADNCLILIDDTDVGSGGKGKLIIPLRSDNRDQNTITSAISNAAMIKKNFKLPLAVLCDFLLCQTISIPHQR